MNSETNLIKLIIEKGNWEEIIYHVIAIENINPWDIDLVKLCDGFINFLEKAKELDFRIPAKVIFVASILLKIKTNYLFGYETKEEKIEEKKEEKVVERIDVTLERPIRRIPKSPIAVEDLILALRRVVELKEKKEIRLWERKRRVELKIERIKDFEKILSEIYLEIENRLKSKDEIKFREIVEEWKSEKIVGKFLPILHLDNKGKIKCYQKEFFDEIFIKKPS